MDTKSTSRESKKLKKPSPEKLDARREELKAESTRIQQEAAKLKDKKVVSSEARFQGEYLRMLKYNSRLIRRLNQHLESTLSSRDIYALSTIMSQQREVINDLRAMADLSQQVGMIYDQSVRPFMSDLTQLLTDVYYQLRRLIMETSRPKETQFALNQLDDLVKQMGIGMQTSQGVLCQSIEGILVGTPKDTVKTQKKHKR